MTQKYVFLKTDEFARHFHVNVDKAIYGNMTICNNYANKDWTPQERDQLLQDRPDASASARNGGMHWETMDSLPQKAHIF